MSSDYWALMPDPYAEEPGRDPESGKCDMCLRKNHLYSVGEAPGQGAFGPQLWLCGPCVSMPVTTCPSCGEQYRVPSTQPIQHGAMCHRCRCDLADYFDNLREQA